MGCDIHLYVEYKKGENWLSADIWQQDEYGKMKVPYQFEYYGTRAYNLFSMLGDCGRGEHKPIIEPRGFPTDSSEILKWYRQSYGEDGHDDSWITFEELNRHNDQWKSEDVNEDWRVCLHRLWQLRFDKCVKDAEIRIVFWFDN